jgi:hypothetical protein
VQWWDGKDWQTDQQYDDGNYGSNNDHVIEMTSPVKTTKLRLYNMYAGSNVMIQEWEVFPAQATDSPFVAAPEGRVYVFDGGESIQPEYNVSYEDGQGGYSHVITNTVNSTGLANSQLELGDINGDGYNDIIIGSNGIQYSGLTAGAVEVVFGGTNLPELIDLFEYSHVNITSFENFRLGRVTVADLNGDGIDDLVTCSPMGFFDFKGGVFVFYGDTLFPTGERSILDYDIMIRGPYEASDIAVKGLPDLNGDGRDELMVFTQHGIDYSEIGTYWIIYSSSLDGLYNDVYYMHLQEADVVTVSYTHLTLPTTPYV